MPIDVGAAATTRLSVYDFSVYTLIGLDNPANDNGYIDAGEIYLASSSGSDVWVGCAFLVSGTTYQIRDSESVGSIAAGSKQTLSGLDIDVLTGDYVATFNKSGSGTIYMDATGGAGVRINAAGESIDPGDSAAYSLGADYVISLYLTGVIVEITSTIISRRRKRFFSLI